MNGFAAAFGYFLFYYLNRIEGSSAITALGLASISCYLVSVHLPPHLPEMNGGETRSGRSTPSVGVM